MFALDGECWVRILSRTMSLYKSNRISVCVYQRIQLIAEPIWFFFYNLALKVPRKIQNYFRGGYHYPQKRNRLQKNPPSTQPKMPLKASMGISAGQNKNVKVFLKTFPKFSSIIYFIHFCIILKRTEEGALHIQKLKIIILNYFPVFKNVSIG